MQAAFIAHGALLFDSYWAPVNQPTSRREPELLVPDRLVAVPGQRATDRGFHRLVSYRRTAKISPPLLGYAGLQMACTSMAMLCMSLGG
jgi:hypothetical protein